VILLNTSINHRVVGKSYTADQLLAFEKYLRASELGTWITCWKENEIFICRRRKCICFFCFV